MNVILERFKRTSAVNTFVIKKKKNKKKKNKMFQTVVHTYILYELIEIELVCYMIHSIIFFVYYL